MTDNASSNNNNKIQNNINANGVKTNEINIKEIRVKMNNGWQYISNIILNFIIRWSIINF